MYLFYLGGLLLPVTPSAFTLKEKNQNRCINLVNGEEIVLPQVSGLAEISFSALLPMVSYPFSVYEGDFKDGREFMEAFREMKGEAEPVWFRIIRTKNYSSTDIYCIIEELSFKEDAAEGSDITCDIVLRQYRTYSTYVVNTASGTALSTESSSREVPQSVTVATGDTLWTIAKRYYGDGSRYYELYQKNRDIIEAAAVQNDLICSESGRYLFAGTVLSL